MVLISPEEYEKIHKWMKSHRKMLQNIYHLFLHICNEKYHLELYNSKALYHDLSIYFYYTLCDDYGMLDEEKKMIKKSLIYGEEYLPEEEKIQSDQNDLYESEFEEEEEEWEESILSKYNMEEIHQKFFENHKEDTSLYQFSPKSNYT
jgi:hypothetical protein